MKSRIALLSVAAATLSMAAFSTPANAQRYYRSYDYGRTETRCDRDGDRCATYRCDRDGDECRRISGWYARSHIYHRSYYDRDRYDRDRYRDRYREDSYRRSGDCDRDDNYCR